MASGIGAMRYPAVKHFEDLKKTSPIAVYGTQVGPEGLSTFRMFEDSFGDIWISGWAKNSLARWERARDKLHFWKQEEGWCEVEVTAFREDRSGNLWLGLWGHDLARYRHGRFEYFRREDGVPDGTILSMLVDKNGRLWAGTTKGGLLRIDNPGADKPDFRIYDTKAGLSSNDVRAITEDTWGRIYFWTGRGVDRLDPATSGIVHFTEADGLIPIRSDHQVAYTDRHGNLWFGLKGLSKLVPLQTGTSTPPSQVRLERIRVRGVPMAVSELGETQLSGIVLQPNQNNIEIEFGSLKFGVGEVLRYQYKLEGADGEWSSPSVLRVVNYADLKPGHYRFSVQAMNDDGIVNPTPAALDFRILAPVWQRGWFLALAWMLVAIVAYFIYRYRLNRLLELERVRTRIASDLHDEVGSGLTQIAILSEVARRQEISPVTDGQMERIADLSRELVDDMSEIVWSLNPQHDQVADLVQRMRRFSSDVFVAGGVEFEFHSPEGSLDIPLRSDVRRQIYLIFKEATINCVRHAKCTRARIGVKMERGEFQLMISDNGRGLGGSVEGDRSNGGHGLKSMRERAKAIGGIIEITSLNGEGTQIYLRVPIGRQKLSTLLNTT